MGNALMDVDDEHELAGLPLQCRRSPVIILGAPRSGTTLLADLLQRLGLFIGHKMVEDLEAAYFFEANRAVIKRAHGYWDHPAAMRYLVRDEAASALTARCLATDARSWRIGRYLGWRRYRRHRGLAGFDEPWGWKDPVNTFTLPLWLKVFPGAKAVCIVRNGVDAAVSLRQMESRFIARRRASAARLLGRLRYRSALERWSFKGAARCLEIDGAFTLWEEYVNQADETLAALGDRQMLVRYEDLLQSPRPCLTALCAFCELPKPDAATLDALIATLRTDRAAAYKGDPALAGFYSDVKQSPAMLRHGYGDVSDVTPATNSHLS